MRKVLFVFLCVFLSLLTVFSLIFLPVQVKNANNEVESLEIWHIDCFEGGFGSRYSLLQSLGREYSNKAAVLISVKSHTVFSAEENFKKGIFPDLISYGNGLNLPYERLLAVKEKNYALPWCVGGYLLIFRKGITPEKVIISQQKYTLSKLAYSMHGVKLPIKAEISSEKAIYEFYADKTCALLGTQRDLFRLERKGIEVETEPIMEFSDLYQYVSICCEEKKLTLARSFIEFLLTKCTEGCLKGVGMLTSLGYLEKACDINLSVFNGVSFEYSTNSLISREQIEKLQKQSLDYEKEKESIKCALKRLK